MAAKKKEKQIEIDLGVIPLVKEESVFTKCVEVYFEFAKKRTGFKPPWGKLEGRAMNDLIEFIKSNVKDESRIVEAWQLILDSYEDWGERNKQFIKVNQIYSGIINIFLNVKNARTKQLNGGNRSNKSEQRRDYKQRVLGGASGTS